MTEKEELDILINKAALDVLTLARNTLLVKFRFLDAALNRLQPAASEDATFSTDGVHLTYGPKHVLKRFKSDRDEPACDFLHIVLHCIFSHMFIGDSIDRELWDLACDVATENIINDLGLRDPRSARYVAQMAETDRLREEIRTLTAEKIYRFYREAGIPGYEIERLGRLFHTDDHSGWYGSKPDHRDFNEDADHGKDREPEHAAEPYEQAGDDNREADDKRSMPMDDIEEEWKKIAEMIQEDLETFSREQGDNAGGLIQNLNAVTRDRYDYTNFLKKFAVQGETLCVNDEEFDYIFYTYGLKLYGNMPLVEPLEYKEVRRIREFVIAVDTSGSTSGDLVQAFLRKTYNILKSTESYFSHVNVHIIQCDAAIQEHVRISSEEEFDGYISTMSIRGLGGTDFRPVFDLVDSLIEDGEFTDLRGLLYFTDGRGTYPARRPGYETAFVFLDNEYNQPEVPPWAIRLVLQDEDIYRS